MSATAVKIGPRDHGQRMALADFEHAEVQEGKLYELGRGRIVVSEVANPWHFMVISAIRSLLLRYQSRHSRPSMLVAGSNECKIVVFPYDSERHPDLAVYLTPPPRPDSLVWREWIPEVVIEVVSPGSEKRDYEEKPEEYLAFGVQEYWIVDPRQQQVLFLRRQGEQWQEETLQPGQTLTSNALAGFTLPVAEPLAAGQPTADEQAP